MTRRWLLIGLGCAALLAIGVALALHSSYSPGPLLKGHQAFGSNCAACHEPWRGVAVASTGCVDCHGKMPDNPHSGTKVSDTTSGLIAGRKLLSFHDNLACMSCHTDHIGRVIDLADTSGRNCAWCHQHDSIEDVSAHRKKPMLLSGATVQLFDKPFSHQQHLQDTIDHLQKATQQVQKLRSPDRKKQAEAEVAALSGVLDSSGQHLQCRTCHIVQPGVAGHRDKFAIAEAGCTISGCHASWRDPELKLADIAPQYAAQQSPDTPEPALIDYVAPDRFQFVKAVFAHSEGHLRSKCGECHLDMESSAKPGDFHGKRASNCFTCHAHESGTAVTQKAESSLDLIGARVAMAALHPPSEKNVTGCAECHAFHINYHGATRILDFTKKAPTVRPRPAPGLRLAFYSVHLSLNHKTDAMRLHVRPSTWHPWLIGLTAIMIGGIAGFAYIRYFPLPAATRVTRATVAPQRTPEIPALDDSFQHRERPLCRRRNGRDRIDQSGDAIRTAGSRLYRECAQGLATDGSGDIYDLAIVGCGPAGIGATTTAKKHGLKYIALEETTAASTIRNYPRGKFVQATPIDINEYGAFMMEGDNSKESLVKKWMEMIAATQIAIEERQEVTGIKRAGDAFEVSTSSAKAFKARFVILAIGVRGSPRKLNIPGEEQDRVFYNLIEPEGNSGFASACVTSAPALPPPTTRMGFPCITQYRELLVPRCDLGAAGHARERREDQRAAAAWAHHRVYIEPIGGNQTGQGGAGAARGAIGAATDGGSGNYSAFRKRSSWRTM